MKLITFAMVSLTLMSCGQETDQSTSKTPHLDAREGKPPTVNIEVKPEHTINRDEMCKGVAIMTGKPSIPVPEESKAVFYYSGNTGLIALLKDVRIKITDPVVIDSTSIEEVAKIINDAMPKDNQWKLKVAHDAKQLKISGKIHEYLALALSELMQANENFHCVISDRIVELRKGDLPDDSPAKLLTPLPTQ